MLMGAIGCCIRFGNGLGGYSKEDVFVLKLRRT
jgi:hypothetical protein